jgi:hypothetical protein
VAAAPHPDQRWPAGSHPDEHQNSSEAHFLPAVILNEVKDPCIGPCLAVLRLRPPLYFEVVILTLSKAKGKEPDTLRLATTAPTFPPPPSPLLGPRSMTRHTPVESCQALKHLNSNKTSRIPLAASYGQSVIIRTVRYKQRKGPAHVGPFPFHSQRAARQIAAKPFRRDILQGIKRAINNLDIDIARWVDTLRYLTPLHWIF